MAEELVRGGFSRAAEMNVGGWDGYYAEIATEEGVGTILTIDDGFEQVEGCDAEVVLSPGEFATLNEFLGY